MLVGGVALVHGAASHLHRMEDDGVTQHLSAEVRRGTCGEGGNRGIERMSDGAEGQL